VSRRKFIKSFSGLSAGLLVSSSDWLAPFSKEGFGLDNNSYRELFPRLDKDVFLNAAGGTPLSKFSEDAINKYLDFWKHGGNNGRDQIFRDVLSSIRAEFASLVGADETEIALVHCTKEGEQLVLNGLRPWDDGGNVVTNVFHFSGSLHNYVGHQKADHAVRIVRSDGWELDVQKMIDAIDESTNLVAVTLLSNVNGRMEDVKTLIRRAREVGAYVYADIIQAAGIYPIDLHELDVDFAACSAYKWLYGPHGVGFFYARKNLQGRILEGGWYPGHVRHQFPPWTTGTDEGFTYSEPVDARRYEPGHHSYIGYAAVLAGLRFIHEVGVDELLDHSIKLGSRLLDRLDSSAYPCITPLPLSSPIVTFEKGVRDLVPALVEHDLVVSLSERQIRVSPGVYNNEHDIDLLADALNRAAAQ
jgi:selenocysteine lyase/cysteine desulfurase